MLLELFSAVVGVLLIGEFTCDELATAKVRNRRARICGIGFILFYTCVNELFVLYLFRCQFIHLSVLLLSRHVK